MVKPGLFFQAPPIQYNWVNFSQDPGRFPDERIMEDGRNTD